MNELQQLPDMTLEEAQAKHAQLKSLESVMRSSLLEMRDRKGWKALGYSSWAEYGEAEWGYGRQYLDRLATASRIQQIVAPMGAQISERITRPLGKVDDADKKALFDEAVERALAEGKKLGAKMMEDVVAEHLEKNKTLQASLDNYQTMYNEANQQREKLRNDLMTSVEAKVNERISESRAVLILENQQALAEAKRIADNAKDEIKQLKKDQSQAIKDGVSRELHSLQSEIDQKRYQLEQHERDIEALKKTKSELDAEVGALAIHKESIKNIKENLSFIASHFDEAFYTQDIPPEVLNDWKSIHYAVSQLKRQLGNWIEQKQPIESVTLDDLLDVNTILNGVEGACA